MSTPPSQLPLPKKRRRGPDKSNRQPVYYHDYLQLDKVLGAQRLLSAIPSPLPEGLAPQSASSGEGSPRAPFPVDPKSQEPSGSGCPLFKRARDQAMASEEEDCRGAHDEHLFIVIHQTYELWFKQILWELGSVTRLFSADYVPEGAVGTSVSRLHRVCEILRVLVDQMTILETMSPTGFLEFRDFLFPASGFQSVQFRLLENMLGLKRQQRVSYGEQPYCSFLQPDHAATVSAAEEQPSLRILVERWLERTPFLQTNELDFWDYYRTAVRKTLDADRNYVIAAARRRRESSEPKAAAGGSSDGGGGGASSSGPAAGQALEQRAAANAAAAGGCPHAARLAEAAAAARAKAEAEGSSSPRTAEVVASAHGFDADPECLSQLREVDEREAHFAGLLDAEKYESLRANGSFVFSHRAMQAALLIALYQDEPILGHAFRMLQALQDVDELLTQWRHRHALMVHRMLGVKMGTGGSSGFSYLKATATDHRVFRDLFNLSTFLIPRAELPPLPDSLRRKLAFQHETAGITSPMR
jgi:tryptophan 2,3-dioxygenase